MLREKVSEGTWLESEKEQRLFVVLEVMFSGSNSTRQYRLAESRRYEFIFLGEVELERLLESKKLRII